MHRQEKQIKQTEEYLQGFELKEKFTYKNLAEYENSPKQARNNNRYEKNDYMAEYSSNNENSKPGKYGTKIMNVHERR
jgi:hypothetical protein